MDNFVVKAFNPAEVNFTPGERSDVSWITLDCVDNERDVVIARGVDLKSVFLKNPVVMCCHDYQKAAVGTSAWIKMASAGDFQGLCAKTMYEDDEDSVRAFELVRKGLLRGKSIGFRPPHDMQPGEWGPPTEKELKARPDWEPATRVIRRCVLLEYSVCGLPMNQEALTIAVAKGLKLPSYFGPMPPAPAPGPGTIPIPELPPHRTLAQVEDQIAEALAKAFDPEKLARAAMDAALDRALGVI